MVGDVGVEEEVIMGVIAAAVIPGNFALSSCWTGPILSCFNFFYFSGYTFSAFFFCFLSAFTLLIR